jgi:hypothetical protein
MTHDFAQPPPASRVPWMQEVGFRERWAEHLAGPDSMVVGIK